MQIILASGSPRRKELLSAYGIEYRVVTSEADETIEKCKPEEMVQQLSCRKARAVWERLKKDHGIPEKETVIIIGADTIVAYKEEILGKPSDREDAARMLRLLAGHAHQVYTGVTFITGKPSAMQQNGYEDEQVITFAEKTDVYVRDMTDKQIADYVATGECDDKAGAYAIQGLFGKYIDHYDGDFHNVVGLPADRVLLQLWKCGYHLPVSHAKMVVTDIDGTLVKDSSPEVYPEMIETIKELRKNGILFCIASGRQYYSIRNMFRAVADDIIFLCENGAHVVYHGQNLHIKEMKRELVEPLLKELRTCGEDHCYVISTTEGSYLEQPAAAFETLIRDSYHNKYEITEDFLQTGKEAIKIAIYHKGSIRQLGEEVLIPEWETKLKTCMAGEEWVDFMSNEVDKGNALRFLQEYFRIRPEETMVFGDNANDLGMLGEACDSYVVSNARPEVKEKAGFLCPAYWYQGVEKVIRDRLLTDRT